MIAFAVVSGSIICKVSSVSNFFDLAMELDKYEEGNNIKSMVSYISPGFGIFILPNLLLSIGLYVRSNIPNFSFGYLFLGTSYRSTLHDDREVGM